MENGYNISIVEECEGALVRVYLEPQCSHASHRRKLGYIEDDGTFHCLNDSIMTLEVMNALASSWSAYNLDKEARRVLEDANIE